MLWRAATGWTGDWLDHVHRIGLNHGRELLGELERGHTLNADPALVAQRVQACKVGQGQDAIGERAGHLVDNRCASLLVAGRTTASLHHPSYLHLVRGGEGGPAQVQVEQARGAAHVPVEVKL